MATGRAQRPPSNNGDTSGKDHQEHSRTYEARDMRDRYTSVQSAQSKTRPRSLVRSKQASQPASQRASKPAREATKKKMRKPHRSNSQGSGQREKTTGNKTPKRGKTIPEKRNRGVFTLGYFLLCFGNSFREDVPAIIYTMPLPVHRLGRDRAGDLRPFLPATMWHGGDSRTGVGFQHNRRFIFSVQCSIITRSTSCAA